MKNQAVAGDKMEVEGKEAKMRCNISIKSTAKSFCSGLRDTVHKNGLQVVK